MGNVLKAKTKSEYAKEWRKRMEVENPEYMELRRAKARERANAKRIVNKDNPDYIRAENERKKLSMHKLRQNQEFKVLESKRKKAYMEKPESKKKQSERMKAWRDENRERVKEYQKVWRENNAEHVSKYSKSYMKTYQEKEIVQETIRKRHLKKHYSMTPECFNKMWDAQNGKCAICNCDMLPRGRFKASACVDHNHKTNEIRGLLCRGCNHGIGNLKDSPLVLQNAINYLNERGFYGKPLLED